MADPQERNRYRGRLIRFGLGALLLAGALVWGRSRGLPDLTPPILEIFGDAVTVQAREGIFRAYGADGALLGWAATGEADGYGGPMVLMVGIDTTGTVAGVRVVEERETPIFWRMVRADDYFRGISGLPYDSIDYDYADVVTSTGATLSADAIVASVRSSVARVAGEAFDVRLPLPSRPFEFGLLEIGILVLLAVGVVGHRLRGPLRRRFRWGAQISGLVLLGFWENSPITLARITAFLSGYLPDIRTGLAIYLLLAGFLLTSILYGRNLYCLYACPFGAAQRVVGAIGGIRLKPPPWLVRFLEGARNTIVFMALFVAFLTLQPVLATYEPFAALFALQGTTLQWLLLFLVLTGALVLQTPWCNFFCPMRTFEVAIQDGKRWWKGRGGDADGNDSSGRGSVAGSRGGEEDEWREGGGS